MSFIHLALALLASASSASLPAASERGEAPAEVAPVDTHAADTWGIVELGSEDEVPEKFEDPREPFSHALSVPPGRVTRIRKGRAQKTSAASLLAHPARGPPNTHA